MNRMGIGINLDKSFTKFKIGERLLKIDRDTVLGQSLFDAAAAGRIDEAIKAVKEQTKSGHGIAMRQALGSELLVQILAL